ncbi:hypothetical protein AAHB43_08275 [Staphylococcus pseudintermedius]
MTHPEEYEQKEEDQEALEKDRAAFLKRLKQREGRVKINEKL